MSFLSALGQSAPTGLQNQGPGGGLQSAAYGPALAAALQSFAGVNTGQNALAGQLNNTINGTGGPNLAQQQETQATQQNLQTNAGAIAGQQGLNPALAARAIQMGTAEAQQQAAATSAAARLAQQQQAQGQLAGLYGQQANEITGLAGAQNSQNTSQLANQGLNQSAYATNLGAATSLIGSALSGAGTVATGGIKGPSVGHAEGGDIKEDSASLSDAFAHAVHAKSMTDGGKVDGEAEVEGDSPKNDTKAVLVSPGEIIIPRSIADDPKKILAFVQAIHAQKRAKDVMTASPGSMVKHLSMRN